MKERDLEMYVGSWKLIPSKGGVFEFTVNEELLFSKKAAGRHANPGEIHEILVRKLAEVRSNTAAPR